MADLNFFNIDNCDAVSFDTPTTPDLQYVEYVLGSVVKDFTNVDKYTLSGSYNCCTPTPIDIAPRYQFNPSVIACSSLSPGTGTYTIQIDGIHGDLINLFEISANGSPFADYPYTNINGVVTIDLIVIDGIILVENVLRITTNSGYEYLISFDFNQPAGNCSGSINNVEITYPVLPDGVVEVNDAVAATITVTVGLGVRFTLTADNEGTVGNGITITPDGVSTMDQLVAAYNLANPTNTITLTDNGGGYIPSALEGPYILAGGIDYTYQHLSLNELIGQTTLLPGVYQVIFCEVLYDSSSVCIQNHVFIDCGTLRCQVVNKLVLCIDSNVMDYYNALQWANDCTDSVTYEEFCALYEILIITLETDGCFGRIDECNCTDAETVANKLSPIAYPTQSNNNPCSTC